MLISRFKFESNFAKCLYLNGVPHSSEETVPLLVSFITKHLWKESEGAENRACKKVRVGHEAGFVRHTRRFTPGFKVGAEFRMKMLYGLLSHKHYPDNEIALSLYLRGWKLLSTLDIAFRSQRPCKRPCSEQKSHLQTSSYSLGANICIQSSLK